MLNVTEEMKVTGTAFVTAMAEYNTLVTQHLYRTMIPPFGSSKTRIAAFGTVAERHAQARADFQNALFKANPELEANAAVESVSPECEALREATNKFLDDLTGKQKMNVVRRD